MLMVVFGVIDYQEGVYYWRETINHVFYRTPDLASGDSFFWEGTTLLFLFLEPDSREYCHG